MKIYLVGGAVRDKLLNIEPKEKDYVVVGATANDMLKLGFRQVGKDFPVFLHPKTHEEYALARKERKIGRGYTGFDFDSSPEVTLEEDLLRRDLTINAIAEDTDGALIDPFHGKADLEKKRLRHVSPAFVEDPVRILRVARFAARFAERGFVVAPETNELMKAMVQSGEVDALVAERVWKELERALSEKTPAEFFAVLVQCHAASVLFPDLKAENFQRLKQVAAHIEDTEIRFAVLLYGLTPQQIKDFCEHYRLPTAYRELAVLVVQYYAHFAQAKRLAATELLNLLQETDAFRREARFMKFLQASAAIQSQFSVDVWLSELLRHIKMINIAKLADKNLSGKEIGAQINQLRLAAIEAFIKL